MPLYTFEFNGQTKDIFFNMDDNKVYIDEHGNKWARVYYSPNTSVDSTIDPNSAKDFVRYTGSRRGTVGDIMDLSAELSQKRAGMTGQDHLKEKTFNEYSKKRRGMLHPQQKKEKARKELKKFGITVTD